MTISSKSSATAIKAKLPFPIASLQTAVHNVASRISGHAGSRLAVVEKGNLDDPPNLVTEKDKDAESLLMERLAKLDPQAGFWSEESKPDRPDSERIWVIDPIDGTNNYLSGLPLYGLNVGYVTGDKMVAAVTVAPGLSRTYMTQLGGGAFCNGRPIRVSERTLRMSMLAVAVQPRHWNLLEELKFPDLFSSVRSVRVFGTISLELAWCAAGQVDIWMGGGLPWDYWPGMLMVEEAGGVSEKIHLSGGHIHVAGGAGQVREIMKALEIQS